MPKTPNDAEKYLNNPPPMHFKKCPIEVTMRVLGKKWSLLILRDIAIRNVNRFNQIRRSLPELTPRVLIMRLHELQEAELIQSVTIREAPRIVEWHLTEKGKDVVPILLSVMSFGSKWYPNEVFEDHRARTLEEIYRK